MTNARSRPKKEWGKDLEWVRSVWEGERSERFERDREKWGRNRVDPLYRNFTNLDRSRCVEIKNMCNSCQRVVQDLSRVVYNKGISMDWGSCREAIEQPKSISMDQAAIENAIKSNWRVLIDSLAVERCLAAVEIT